MNTSYRRRLAQVGITATAVLGVTFGIVAPTPTATAVGVLTVTNSTLLFDPGTVAITFGTDASTTSVSWTVDKIGNVPLRSGTSPSSNGVATTDTQLSGLPNGYYKISATAEPSGTSMSTSFGVLAVEPNGATSTAAPFGVNLHPAGSPLVDAVARIGITHARVDATWSTHEPTQGTYDFTSLSSEMSALRTDGIEPLPISDYTNQYYDNGDTPYTAAGLAGYGNYTAAVSDQYWAATHATEVYNEPNNPNFIKGTGCDGQPDCYVKLLDAAYSAAHASHSNAFLVGPALSGAPGSYIESVLQGRCSELNAVSVHPYRTDDNPEGTVGTEGRNTMLVQMQTLVSDIQTTCPSSTIPLWLTEFGWQTTDQTAQEREDQADYLVRGSVLSLAGGAQRLYWYDAIDDSKAFGLFDANSPQAPNAVAPKPSAVAQAVLSAQVAGRSTDGVNEFTDGNTFSFRFGSGSTITRVMWAVNDQSVTVQASGPLTETTEYGVPTQLSTGAGPVSLTLTDQPVYITGPVSSVSLG